MSFIQRLKIEAEDTLRYSDTVRSVLCEVELLKDKTPPARRPASHRPQHREALFRRTPRREHGPTSQGRSSHRGTDQTPGQSSRGLRRVRAGLDEETEHRLLRPAETLRQRARERRVLHRVRAPLGAFRASLPRPARSLCQALSTHRPSRLGHAARPHQLLPPQHLARRGSRLRLRQRPSRSRYAPAPVAVPRHHPALLLALGEPGGVSASAVREKKIWTS